MSVRLALVSAVAAIGLAPSASAGNAWSECGRISAKVFGDDRSAAVAVPGCLGAYLGGLTAAPVATPLGYLAGAVGAPSGNGERAYYAVADRFVMAGVYAGTTAFGAPFWFVQLPLDYAVVRHRERNAPPPLDGEPYLSQKQQPQRKREPSDCQMPQREPPEVEERGLTLDLGTGCY